MSTSISNIIAQSTGDLDDGQWRNTLTGVTGDSSSEDWANVRSGASGTKSLGSGGIDDNEDTGAYAFRGSSGPSRTIRRSYFAFDTSAFSASSIIDSIKLKFYPGSAAYTNFIFIKSTYTDITNSSTYSAIDFNTPYSSAIDGTTFVDGQLFTVVLNQDAIEAAKNNDYLKVAFLNHTHDFSNTLPTTNQSSFGVHLYFSEDGSKKPSIDVEYWSGNTDAGKHKNNISNQFVIQGYQSRTTQIVRTNEHVPFSFLGKGVRNIRKRGSSYKVSKT